MIRFASPEYLYLLVIIPLLIGLYILYVRRGRRLTRLFGDPHLVLPLTHYFSPRRALLRFSLLLIAVGLIITALARPQTGSKLREVTGQGSQIMLAVDVSRSMLADDFKPNRLERTKYAVSRLIERLTNEQIGLVIFAGDAFIQLPITNDFISASSFTRSLCSDMVSKQGTSLQRAIEVSMAAMPDPESDDALNSRAIILITDGESHSDDARAAAAEAASRGIVIHTIGMGTAQGAPMTIDGQIIKDDNGQIVVSKLDEALLNDIAAATQGVYVRSTERSVGLDEIFDHIAKMNKKQFETVIFEQYAEQFFYLLYVVLALLLIEFLLPNHKTIRTEQR